MTVTQYKGPRMVPLVPEPGQREWDKTKSYEYWTLVQYQGASYIAVQNVPVGVEITNENYWLLSANYNAQIEAYRREVEDCVEQVNEVSTALNKKIADIKNGGILQRIFFPLEFSLGSSRAVSLVTNLMNVGYNEFSIIVDIKNGSYSITEEFLNAVYNTGCNIRNFTFHGDVDSNFDLYFDAIERFMTLNANRFNVSEIFAINEKNSFIANNDSKVAEKIKSLKYKVGICFNTDYYYLVCNATNTLNAIDYFGMNIYPSISDYAAKTTDQNIVDAIDNQLQIMNLITSNTNATKIVTEIGCKPTFLAYKNTGDWTISGEWDINATKRYLACVINSNLFRTFEGIGIWYANWFTEYTTMYNFFKNEVINNA